MTDHKDRDRRSIERRLLRYLKPHRSTLTAGLLCAAANAGITALLALAIKLTINHMTEGEVGRLNFVCIVVVFVFLIKGLVAYGQTFFLSLVAQRVTTTLREQIFSHIHSLSLSFF